VGFLYGLDVFSSSQTGTIAAVGVGFARYIGVAGPVVRRRQLPDRADPLSSGYALSLSTTQLVGILLIALLTWTNTRGLDWARSSRTSSRPRRPARCSALIAVGAAARLEPRGGQRQLRQPLDAARLRDIVPGVCRDDAFGCSSRSCVAQTGSLFSADAWNNITFTAARWEDRGGYPLRCARHLHPSSALYLPRATSRYLVTLPSTGSAARRTVSRPPRLERDLPGLGAAIHGDRS
jgi:APA family basic amino acid/polyamine antiporter